MGRFVFWAGDWAGLDGAECMVHGGGEPGNAESEPGNGLLLRGGG